MCVCVCECFLRFYFIQKMRLLAMSLNSMQWDYFVRSLDWTLPISYFGISYKSTEIRRDLVNLASDKYFMLAKLHENAGAYTNRLPSFIKAQCQIAFPWFCIPCLFAWARRHTHQIQANISVFYSFHCVLFFCVHSATQHTWGFLLNVKLFFVQMAQSNLRQNVPIENDENQPQNKREKRKQPKIFVNVHNWINNAAWNRQ